MVTLADVIRDARGLETGAGVSVKFALWVGLLTANAGLAQTCEQAKRLRPYIHKRLPEDSAKVKRLLAGTGLTTVKLGGLYRVQGLEDAGELRGLERLGATYAEQCAWRERVYRLMHGYGMAYKTISMAALLINPLGCELVPVDRHVLARFGLWDTYARSKRNYREVERYVRDERDTAGYQRYSAAVWHWLMWATWIAAKYPNRAALESHQPLSCRF